MPWYLINTPEPHSATWHIEATLDSHEDALVVLAEGGGGVLYI